MFDESSEFHTPEMSYTVFFQHKNKFSFCDIAQFCRTNIHRVKGLQKPKVIQFKFIRYAQYTLLNYSEVPQTSSL